MKGSEGPLRSFSNQWPHTESWLGALRKLETNLHPFIPHDPTTTGRDLKRCDSDHIQMCPRVSVDIHVQPWHCLRGGGGVSVTVSAVFRSEKQTDGGHLNTSPSVDVNTADTHLLLPPLLQKPPAAEPLFLMTKLRDTAPLNPPPLAAQGNTVQPVNPPTVRSTYPAVPPPRSRR